jgi:hypothetical protein
MFIRDLERLARTMAKQKMEASYIRHYLMETYQIENKIVDQIFTRIGISDKPAPKGKAAAPSADPMGDRRKRQGF